MYLIDVTVLSNENFYFAHLLRRLLATFDIFDVDELYYRPPTIATYTYRT